MGYYIYKNGNPVELNITNTVGSVPTALNTGLFTQLSKHNFTGSGSDINLLKYAKHGFKYDTSQNNTSWEENTDEKMKSPFLYWGWLYQPFGLYKDKNEAFITSGRLGDYERPLVDYGGTKYTAENSGYLVFSNYPTTDQAEKEGRIGLLVYDASGNNTLIKTYRNNITVCIQASGGGVGIASSYSTHGYTRTDGGGGGGSGAFCIAQFSVPYNHTITIKPNDGIYYGTNLKLTEQKIATIKNGDKGSNGKSGITEFKPGSGGNGGVFTLLKNYTFCYVVGNNGETGGTGGFALGGAGTSNYQYGSPGNGIIERKYFTPVFTNITCNGREGNQSIGLTGGGGASYYKNYGNGSSNTGWVIEVFGSEI